MLPAARRRSAFAPARASDPGTDFTAHGALVPAATEAGAR
jgi:hypothetical protein